jgi:hypothetical protein
MSASLSVNFATHDQELQQAYDEVRDGNGTFNWFDSYLWRSDLTT